MTGESMANISFAVCILFYERPEQPMECAGGVLSSGVAICVVHNGSPEPARKGLGEFCAEHGQRTIIDSYVNLGRCRKKIPPDIFSASGMRSMRGDTRPLQ